MAYSCEDKRSKAYSSDLRWRMIYQVEVLGMSYRKVAASLLVDPSTVHRTVGPGVFKATGDVQPKAYPPNGGTAKLTVIDKMMILELVIQKPGIYLREIHGHILE